jgi:hypothetical protein
MRAARCCAARSGEDRHETQTFAAGSLCFAAAGFFASAWNSSYSTDHSDLWRIPSESGWL